jgi:hypothetical protein
MSRLFGPLPTRGIWTPLGLTRDQFFGILTFSIALFVVVGGPVWAHVHDKHFGRIAVSYAAIPLAVALALYRNARLGLLPVVVASAVIALLKLIATAGLLVVLALARS